MVFESRGQKNHVISTSEVTLVPQSFSQYGEQERKEAARAEIHGNPRDLIISESLDMFSYIIFILSLANKKFYSTNKLMARK